MNPKNWEGSDFYQDLGVATSASQFEIKAAYRSLVREYHPDVNSSLDRGERFRIITSAYAVLGNVQNRKNYDQYLFETGALPPRMQGRKKKKQRRFLRILARLTFLLLLLMLLRNFGLVGPSVSIQTNPDGTQFVNIKGGKNQVLALMVGAQGPPGPAGIAGEKGFIGMNGYDGKDGLPGAPGVIGEQGPAGIQGEQGAPGIQGPEGLQGIGGEGVTVEPIEVGDDAYCKGLGGALLITADSTVVVCNGAPNTEGTGGFGTGYVNLGACDSSVKISLASAYADGRFKMKAISIGQLAGACDGQILTTVLKIKSSGIAPDGPNTYVEGDAYICSATLNINTASEMNSILLTSGDCTNDRTGDSTFSTVYASDISSASDALLIQIAAP